MSGMKSSVFKELTDELSVIIAALVVESAFYVLYAILFGTCVCILCKRRQKSTFVIFLVTVVIMFALSTAHIIYIFYTTFSMLNRGPILPENGLDINLFEVIHDLVDFSFFDLPLGAMYVTNNVIADGFIVYRCYMVWGFKKRVIIVPALLVIVGGLFGYTSPVSIYMFGLSLLTNVLVTALIAGRIWWIARQIEATLGRKHSRKYNTSIAIIVESGAFYSISLMVLIIARTTQTIIKPSATANIVYAAVAQIVGIVPTLIIVRVGLGLGAQHSETLKSTSPPAPEFGRVDPPSSQPLANNSGNFGESDQTLTIAAV